MTNNDLLDIVRRALADIAPEADVSALRPDVPLRDQLDLDSMDVLNFVVALNGALGVEVPEADYGKLVTLERCVDYLETARRARAS
jgi:acyl carrier protein